MLPPLIELRNFCNDKGFEVLPGEGKKLSIWKDDAWLKDGEKEYPSYIDGEKEVYSKIYLKLTT